MKKYTPRTEAELDKEIASDWNQLRKDKERLEKRNSSLVATCVLLQAELKNEAAKIKELERETAELRKDKERLDYILAKDLIDLDYTREKLDQLMEDDEIQRERERCYRQEV